MPKDPTNNAVIDIIHKIEWFYVSRSKPRTFKFKGEDYRYFYNPYNATWKNERCVEVPIIFGMAKLHDPSRVLEVGNVLSHYYPATHDIIDKYEEGIGITKADVLDFKTDKRYELILSISTLEHVGWDEEPKDDDKIKKSLNNLRTMLAQGGKIVCTMPLGYNPNVNRLIQEGYFDEVHYMRRVNSANEWEETENVDLQGIRYNSPFRFANYIVVALISSR